MKKVTNVRCATINGGGNAESCSVRNVGERFITGTMAGALSLNPYIAAGSGFVSAVTC